MYVHIDGRSSRNLKVATNQTRVEWLFALTRAECDALLHRVLSWDQAAASERFCGARQRLTETLSRLYAHPLRRGLFKDLGAGEPCRIGPRIHICTEPDLDAASIGTLLGWLYVAEGARLHLHVLGRMARRADGQPNDPAENTSAMARWGVFVTVAEQTPLGSADLRDMPAGARSAFRYIRAALDVEGE